MSSGLTRLHVADIVGTDDERDPLLRRRKKPPPLDLLAGRDFTLGSEEETGDEEDDVEGGEGSGTPSRKTSRVTLNESLNVIVDDDAEATSSSERESLLKEVAPPSFSEYFWGELTRGYSLENDQSRYTEKRRKVVDFLLIWIRLERFLFYGLLQCVDAFAYLFTFLPIRFVMSLIGVVTRSRPWTTTETCDFLKVGIIVICSLLMQYVDTSVIYHMVRGQAVIKLYMFYNMLEVGDKLFSSLGQDILESLFWTATEGGRGGRRSWGRTALHFSFAVVYALIHALIVLLQATTLNVAFNSHNEALLTIMMSNNFVELKGSVFKKFAKANLFQMACSDVRERFHQITLLFFVVLRNMGANGWKLSEFVDMLPNLFLIMFSECVVDWLKHAFITKFNEINKAVYKDFTITIAFDVVRSRQESAFSDYSDQVARRMGFIPIPLSIMLIRVITQTFSLDSGPAIVLAVLVWLLLLTIKIANALLMLGLACYHVSGYRDLQESAQLELHRRKIMEKKSKSAPSSPTAPINLIDFTDVLHQPQGPKGMTASDWLGQTETLGRIGDSDRKSEERTPRRSLSLANIPRPHRDKSAPPPAIPEGEEEEKVEKGAVSDDGGDKAKDDTKRKEEEKNAQVSPKKKVAPAASPSEAENLSDVTAYTMLSPDRGVERIE